MEHFQDAFSYLDYLSTHPLQYHNPFLLNQLVLLVSASERLMKLLKKHWIWPCQIMFLHFHLVHYPVVAPAAFLLQLQIGHDLDHLNDLYQQFQLILKDLAFQFQKLLGPKSITKKLLDTIFKKAEKLWMYMQHQLAGSTHLCFSSWNLLLHIRIDLKDGRRAISCNHINRTRLSLERQQLERSTR